MPVGRLREGARAREQLAVDEADRGPERNVLRQRERQGQPARVHLHTAANRVEGEADEGAVRGMEDQPDRSPAAAEHVDVRMTAAEDPLVERLLHSPHDRRDGSGSGGSNPRRHTLPACPKGTLSTAPRSGYRSSSGSSSKSRPRTRAQR